MSIGTTRTDLNLSLSDCRKDHLDHYYLKFEFVDAEIPFFGPKLRARLFRFGSPEAVEFALNVGDSQLSDPLRQGDVFAINQQIPTRYQASQDLLNRFNLARVSTEDTDGDGFVELPLYFTVSNEQQDVIGGIRIADIKITASPADILAITTPHGGDGTLYRFDGRAGIFLGIFGGGCEPIAMTFGPDEQLYVAYRNVGSFGSCDPDAVVKRFDGRTGNFLEFSDVHADYIPASDPRFVFGPGGLAFGPDGNLFVSDFQDNSVHRYQGPFGANPGSFIDTFVPSGSGGLREPSKLLFGPDGSLYVISESRVVLRYQGPFASFPGTFLDNFVMQGSGGLGPISDMNFGPDGNLYVLSSVGSTSSILRYAGPSGGLPGAFIDVFVAPGAGGLGFARGLTFGPDGNLYVSADFSNRNTGSGIFRYSGQTATPLGIFTKLEPHSLVGSAGPLLFSSIPDPVADLGDYNQDGCVDRSDLGLLIAVIGQHSGPGSQFDLNSDGRVDVADSRKLVLLFTNPGGMPCQ